MGEYSKDGHYYKYRSLGQLDRFLSILIDRRLYGALYYELNDPMEGYFQYSSQFDKDLLRRIVAGKQKTYICSLSRCGNIGLMWTHYADENRGCCIELQVTSKTWSEHDIIYAEQLPSLTDTSKAEDILSTKAKMWEYEQETRFLSQPIEQHQRRPMLSIRITRILLGCNISKAQKSFYRKLIKSIDGSIEVVNMRKDELNYGYRL